MNPQQKFTQLQRVEKRLLERGSISRNECLSTFPAITRLGARIIDLQTRGYVFRTERKHGDYIYFLVSASKAKQLSLV